MLPFLLAAAIAVATAGLLHRGSGAPNGRIEQLLASGDYAQAELLAERTFASAQAFGARSEERETAASLLVRSLVLNGKGAAEATRSVAEQAVRISERAPGAAGPSLATNLLNLGRVLVEKPELDRALAAIERAVSIRERQDPPDRESVAEGLDTLGYALVRAGRLDDAIEVLEKSLGVRETTAASANVARTLVTLGYACQRKAEYGRAGQLIRRAEAIAAQEWNERPAHAEVLDFLGLQYWFEGDLVAARNTAERAVAIGERTLRPDHPALARSLRYLAGAELDLGNVATARALLERATSIIERARGRDHPETTLYVNDLAGPTLSLGDYPAARQLYERALQTAETAYGPWHDTVATAAYNLALVDKSLGDLEGARADLERARNVWERTFRPDHPFVALALTDLASVRRQQGASGDAIALLDQALAIRENSLGRDHRDVAMTLADMAATRVAAGQFDDARPLVSRAVAIWERQEAPDAPDYAVVLALNARLAAILGDPVASGTYARRALDIRQRVFGSAHPMVAEARAILAEAEASLGNTDTAVELAASAESGGLDHLRLLLRSLPEREALNYASSRPRGLDTILSIMRPGSPAVPVAFNRVIRGRGVVLDEMAARQAARATSAEGSALRLTLDAARQRLANLVVRGPSQLSTEQHAALVADARGEAERAERVLAEHSAAFRFELQLTQIGLTDVQTSLPSGSVLVSYVRYEHGFFGSKASERSRRPSYAAFILRALSPPVVVRLGEAAEVERLVTAWRDSIARYPATAGSLRDHRTRQSGARLRAQVWDPIAPHLTGASRVFIVPDGALGLVPLAALPAGDSSFVLEVAPPIHYLTAERDLISTASKHGSRGMLALGGATFDDGPALVASRTMTESAGEVDVGVVRSARLGAQPCGDSKNLALPGARGHAAGGRGSVGRLARRLYRFLGRGTRHRRQGRR